MRKKDKHNLISKIVEELDIDRRTNRQTVKQIYDLVNMGDYSIDDAAAIVDKSRRRGLRGTRIG